RDYLIAEGVPGLGLWTLNGAMGISNDGRTIVGIGRDPQGRDQGWIATIPEPNTLALAAIGFALAGWRLRRPYAPRGCHPHGGAMNCQRAGPSSRPFNRSTARFAACHRRRGPRPIATKALPGHPVAGQRLQGLARF